MKKSLLALAVLGAFASAAQAQVTIGGWMAVQPKAYKVGNVNNTAGVRTAGQTTQTEYRLDDDTNSRIWFTGKEDLGGGNDAHFYMESRFGGDNGSNATTFGLANGDTFVGLGSTAVGTLDFGRISSSAYTQGILVEYDRVGSASNFGTTTLLSDVGGFGVLKTRLNNIIRYKSPNWGGFQLTVAGSPSVAEEGKAPAAGAAVNNGYTDGRFVALGGSYTNGGLYLNAYYDKLTQEGNPTAATGFGTFAQADQATWRLSGAYKFPFGLKVGLSVDRTALKNVAAGSFMGAFTQAAYTNAAQGGGVAAANGEVSRTAWVLPVSYTMGNHGFYAKIGKANNLSNWNTAGTGNSGGTGAKFGSLSYDYALSKRTAVGASWTKIKNDGNGTYQQFASGSTHNGSGTFAGESVTNLQLNLKHSF